MTCPICDDSFIVVVQGPDDFGNYETDDCPCQILPDDELADLLAELLEKARESIPPHGEGFAEWYA